MDNQDYTNNVKRLAIIEILADLFKGTLEYSNDIKDRWDNPIEPDIDALIRFRGLLGVLGEMIRTLNFESELKMFESYLIESVKTMIYKVGYKYLHVNGSYLTGVWGVRYMSINDILKILSIEHIPDLYNRTAMIYDLHVRITSVKVTDNEIWYELTPIENKEVREFSIDISWDNFKNGYLSGLILDELESGK